MKKRHAVLYAAALIFAVFITYRTTHHDYYNAITVTGATPIAVAKTVPSGFSLAIDGMVKKPCRLSDSALRAFATTRIRTAEISAGGGFMGTYIHVGIPVFNILEGIAPRFPEESLWGTPTDFLITFTSKTGERVYFSYGELLMTDDSSPATLAFFREELLPTSDPEEYTLNVDKGGLDGFRLIVPGDRDTSRYLSGVISITFSIPEVPDDLLPPRRKGLDCTSQEIVIVQGPDMEKTSFEGVERRSENAWVRVGHGKGYKGTAAVAGYSLGSFLEHNMPGFSIDDLILFVSCDGYRCLFSSREIFGTENGRNMVIITEMDGDLPPGGNILACLNDYFIDRSIWGVTHVLPISLGELRDQSPARKRTGGN